MDAVVNTPYCFFRLTNYVHRGLELVRALIIGGCGHEDKD